jgi:hypothetical protein
MVAQANNLTGEWVMQREAELEAYFSDICIDRCGGMCCDPWWGIISYTVKKPGGASGLDRFTSELARGIRQRAGRIVEGYVTGETPPRRLFTEPEVYNVRVRSIHAEGTTLVVELLAIYAFRCGFLSTDNVCTIHPSVIGGDDIRPPHCGQMGSPEAMPDGKGFCRILHAAGTGGGAGGPGGAERVDRAGTDEAVEAAIGVERGAGRARLAEGFSSAAEAAAAVAGEIKRYCEEKMPGSMQGKGGAKAGRNDPCPCGSGRKYKKCCGG